METESSRRPFVRSREPDLKKPRLSQDPILAVDRSSNGRPTFMQRPATTSSAVSRSVGDRGGNSESSYSARGPYSHVQQQQQHLELVNEYKTALAELTFNSKPIITNLTIIAGENLDAAKAIATTICSHILEVPSEQKLPSLYLLDSIVKNIGRDYIKYFGSKLPEVFCKAYRQVDPPVHSSMKHLFGTWKGVFPPQPLQTIEKDLGFAAAANRLPVGTSRLDAPVSRPAHSIHVNPKYLEARQRLQQSSKAKAKATGSDPSENVVSSTITERSLGPGRPWADSSSKQNSQYTQRELSNVLHTENISAPEADSEYDSDINQSGFEITQGSEKFPGNGRVIVSSTQRNGFDSKYGLQNYHLSPKRTPNQGLSSQSTIQMTGNWKNSEEEEFMWDDLNSRAGDQDHAASSVRDRWSLDDSEKTSEASVDYLSTEMKDQAVFGNRALSPWSQESHLHERAGSVTGRTIPGLSEGHPIYSGGLSTSAGTNGRTSFQSKVALGSIGSSGYGTSNSHTLGSTVSVVPQRQTLRGSSPPAQSLLYPPDSSSFAGRGVLPVIHHNNTEQDMPHSGIAVESRSSQFSGSPNTDLRTKFGQEALPLPSPDSKRMMSPNAPSSFSVTPHLRQHTSFSQELESENLVSDLSHQVPKQFSDALASTSSSTQSSANSLLAAISGILNINSLSRQSFQTSDAPASQANNLPSLPSGPPQTQFAQSSIGMSISSLLGQPAQSVHSQRNDKEPTGSVTPDLSSSTLPQPANVTNANMPVSSLLSSLVSKGLISATKTESTSNNSQTPSQPQNHGLETTRSGSSKVSVALASLPRSMSNTTSELSSAKPVSASTELPLCSQADITSHIGFQFKGDVLRVLHPAVISQLFDDFPHKCGVCECRLKFEDQVGRHLEWHTLRNQTSNSNKASRVWYAGSVNTLATDSGMVSANGPSGPQEGGLTKRLECIQPMVPADESQCLCILCGDLFEDFYDQGIAQWMFKGAVYATVPCSDVISGNINQVVAQGSIVHEKCISKA